MKIYVKRPTIQGAWMWITKGYARAWESLGFQVAYYDLIEDIPTDGVYDIMARDWDLKGTKGMRAIESARRVYFFAQPSNFPLPWGSHPNFRSQCTDAAIDKLNELDNVHLWTYGSIVKNCKYFPKWKEIATIPLAFDSISYNPIEDDRYHYDACFVGGWANNGFNEKRKIMLDYFKVFKDSGLKCGFFINKNLTHEQENAILYNSKVAINIHDNYQRVLGLDTNERTFKSLGTSGILVSDNIEQIKELNIGATLTASPKEMVNAVKHYVFDTTPEERLSIKESNRKEIIREHTYIKRAEALLELK